MTTETPESSSVDDAFMLRFFAAWKNRDVEAILSMVTDDVVLESGFGPETCGKRFVGKAGMREAALRLFALYPDAQSSGRTYSILGNQGFTEVTYSYTGADGKRVSTRLCDLYTFRDGKVASKRAYGKRFVPD